VVNLFTLLSALCAPSDGGLCGANFREYPNPLFKNRLIMDGKEGPEKI
jgi:hypothetical protein